MLDEGGHQNWWPGDTAFEMMIGAILTQNTAWSNVEKALANLKRKGVLEPKKLDRVPLKNLKQFIRPSGFFNIKAERLKHFLSYFKTRFGYSIKRMKQFDAEFLRHDLLSVKGIGRETADSILLYALNKTIFVIDAYTRRIFSRHGLIEEEMSYDEIRHFFEKNLSPSQHLFNDYHAQIVRVGKNYCRNRPNCLACPLNFLFKVPGLKKSLSFRN